MLPIVRNMILAALVAALISIPGAAIVMGCGTPAPKVASDVTAGLTLGICILSHSTEPVAQIVKDCEGATESAVTTVLSEHKAASIREMSNSSTFGNDAGLSRK